MYFWSLPEFHAFTSAEMRQFVRTNMQGSWYTRGVPYNTVWNQYSVNEASMVCTAAKRRVRRELQDLMPSCPVEYKPGTGHLDPRPRPGSDEPWRHKKPNPDSIPPDDPLVAGPAQSSGTTGGGNNGGGNNGGGDNGGGNNGDGGKPPSGGKPAGGKMPPEVDCNLIMIAWDSLTNGPCMFPSTKQGCSFPNALFDTLLGKGDCQIDQNSICGPGVFGPGTYKACPGEDPGLVEPPKPAFGEENPGYGYRRNLTGEGGGGVERRWLGYRPTWFRKWA
jgi:hypothetical protein